MLVAFALVAVSGASAAHREAGVASSRFGIALPSVGHVSVQFVTLRVTGQARATAPKKLSIQLRSTSAAKHHGVLLAATKVSGRRRRSTTRFSRSS